ncbi:MAG: hypothetical protein HQK67_08715 [Desulfamplus sp.]|nr:hypothetical protein [Desulfamplus sp.]
MDTEYLDSRKMPKIPASFSIQPPAVTDFLPSAISKAVQRQALTHAMTLYPIAAGAGFGVMSILFEMPLLYIATVASFVTGSLWAVIQIFFLHDRLGSRYVDELNQKQQKYQEYLKTVLKNELQECKTINGAEDFVEQAFGHCLKIETKLNSIKDILQLKVQTTEITYGRFAGAAEQVTLAVLDNLQEIVATLKSASSIDSSYIEKRVQSLEQKEQTDENIKQKKVLLERLELKKRQFEKINRLLCNNEEAMTEMEKISALLSEWEARDDFTGTDFESAISRLHELAEQAHEYQKK